MSSVPSELRYLKSHEWVRREADGSITVGITDHAQSQLGDLVFVDLPDVDRDVTAGEACTVVESVKAASDVYSPLSGKVIATNDALRDQPELINAAPYAAGWLFKLASAPASEWDALLSAEQYTAQIAADDH